MSDRSEVTIYFAERDRAAFEEHFSTADEASFNGIGRLMDEQATGGGEQTLSEKLNHLPFVAAWDAHYAYPAGMIVSDGTGSTPSIEGEFRNGPGDVVLTGIHSPTIPIRVTMEFEVEREGGDVVQHGASGVLEPDELKSLGAFCGALARAVKAIRKRAGEGGAS